jgi:hypothetical protein
MKKILLSILVMAILTVTNVYAVKLVSLYQAEVPVISQTSDMKEQAVRDGFLQILIKISGDTQIDRNPVIKAGLRKADYYVQDYSYSAESTSDSQYLLQIRYEPQDINRLLQQAGVPVWGEIRPLVLVWLVVEDNQNQADIIGSESPSDIFSEARSEAKKFGLPLIFPMMDVDEINEVSASDVKEMSLSILKEASKRYAPDALLIGEVDVSNHGVQSKWKLVKNNTQWNWKLEGKSTLEVISLIMNQVSNTLAGRATAKIENPSSLTIKMEVGNVESRRDLRRLMQYLKELPAVQLVEIAQFDSDIVDLSVKVQGTQDAFQQNAVSGRHLIFKSIDDNNMLIFEWVR